MAKQPTDHCLACGHTKAAHARGGCGCGCGAYRAEPYSTSKIVTDAAPRVGPLDAAIDTFKFDEPDLVNHPPHYTRHPSGVECIQITEHMNFNLGNAVKYIWRAGEKGATLEDLRKARWYVEREITRLTRERKP